MNALVHNTSNIDQITHSGLNPQDAENGTVTLLDFVTIHEQANGQVHVSVPAEYLWNCVECFAENCLHATYTYDAPFFVVHLFTAPMERVYEVLGNWRTPAKERSALERMMH